MLASDENGAVPNLLLQISRNDTGFFFDNRTNIEYWLYNEDRKLHGLSLRAVVDVSFQPIPSLTCGITGAMVFVISTLLSSFHHSDIVQ